MAFIRIVNEDEAEGSVAENYARLSSFYSQEQMPLSSGMDMGVPQTPTPHVYRTNSLVPAYFDFGRLQSSVISNEGKFDRPDGAFPFILVSFAVSLHSSCYY